MLIKSGIPGARRKLARAHLHAETLRAEVHAFRDRSPYKLSFQESRNIPGTRDVAIVAKVQEAPPIPSSWPVICGDVFTNVRAALDHAVFHHVRAQAPSVASHYIQFPIVDDPQDFVAKATGRFDARVYGLIEGAQPYHWKVPSAHPLRMLRELVNIDKHRELVMATYTTDTFDVVSSEMYQVLSSVVVPDNEMVVGAVVGRADLQVAEHAMGSDYLDVRCNVTFGESIEVPGVTKRVDLMVAIDRLTERIGPLLDQLEAAGC